VVRAAHVLRPFPAGAIGIAAQRFVEAAAVGNQVGSQREGGRPAKHTQTARRTPYCDGLFSIAFASCARLNPLTISPRSYQFT
jgi:hypothetical protein